MGALTGGLGTANAAAGGAGGLGGNPFGAGGLAGVNSANFLGGGGGGNVNQASMLSNALGNSGRDFDSLSAALGGGGGGGGGGMGMRGGFGGESSERDFRGVPAGGGANFANGQSRAPMGGGSGPNPGGATGQSKSDTIVVRNLPPTVTWQMLRDKYNSVGEVKFAELRGKDMGLIRFNSEWDAERAVRQAFTVTDSFVQPGASVNYLDLKLSVTVKACP
uniref:RRM domain-containing protein n=1 Tax=Timema genevievae TaxID=629358 RepID=A0A7R9PNE2_TIMGE|nr:unnamed protein product [Timema genevievae]